MSTDPDQVRSADAYQIGEELHQTVRHCRMMVRKGATLLKLTQTDRTPSNKPSTRRPRP